MEIEIRTEFSVYDEILKTDELVENCKKNGFESVAVTDISYMNSPYKVTLLSKY